MVRKTFFLDRLCLLKCSNKKILWIKDIFGNSVFSCWRLRRIDNSCVFDPWRLVLRFASRTKNSLIWQIKCVNKKHNEWVRNSSNLPRKNFYDNTKIGNSNVHKITKTYEFSLLVWLLVWVWTDELCLVGSSGGKKNSKGKDQKQC